MLIVALPPETPCESLDFVVSHDGLRVTQQGNCAAQDLPPQSPLVAVLPAARLSWHRVKLPELSRASRVAAAIGLLEDQWLQPAASLHISLHAIPDATDGEDNCWVCVCDATWLKQALEPLVKSARVPQRLVPEFAPLSPGQTDTLSLTGTPQDATVVWCRPQGVLCAPWPAPWPLLRATPVLTWAEPAVAHLGTTDATATSASEVQTQTRAQRWIQAASGPWDLAQGEWSQTPTQRAWRRIVSLGRTWWHAPAWRPSRLALWTLLGVQALGLLSWSWFMQQSLIDQQQQLQRLLTQTFPQTTLVVDAPKQMQQAVQRLRVQVGAPHAAQPEVMLEHLLGSGPGSTGSTALRALRFDGHTLVLQTETPPAFNAAQHQRWQQLGYAVKTSREGVTMTWEGTP
jgi:general secretion pathway protein L